MKLDRNRENKFDLSKIDENFLEKSIEFFETQAYKDYVENEDSYDPFLEPMYITKESAESLIEIMNMDVKLPPYDGVEIKTLPREDIKKFFGK